MGTIDLDEALGKMATISVDPIESPAEHDARNVSEMLDALLSPSRGEVGSGGRYVR